VWASEILRRIEVKEDIASIRRDLNLNEYEFRAAIRTLKSLGLPLVRRGKYYEIVEREPQRLSYKGVVDLLIVMKETVKVLRFLYGDDVRYLWPNKALKGKEVLMEVSEDEVFHNLPSYVYSLITVRANASLKRRRRFSEVIKTLNALLYAEEVSVRLKRGDVLNGKMTNIDIGGYARMGALRLSPEEVEEVLPL